MNRLKMKLLTSKRIRRDLISAILIQGYCDASQFNMKNIALWNMKSNQTHV